MNDLNKELLKALFFYKYKVDEVNYEDVDHYYAFIGYDLELYSLLMECNIYGTSDLMELLLEGEDE